MKMTIVFTSLLFSLCCTHTLAESPFRLEFSGEGMPDGIALNVLTTWGFDESSVFARIASGVGISDESAQQLALILAETRNAAESEIQDEMNAAACNTVLSDVEMVHALDAMDDLKSRCTPLTLPRHGKA